MTDDEYVLLYHSRRTVRSANRTVTDAENVPIYCGRRTARRAERAVTDDDHMLLYYCAGLPHARSEP